ncbi:hypothetical protein C5S42_12540 [Candidatus Methanomarinus sp.]|nr:hypothetical protein C5S42_12540 [ANME-2 cluster archaeon]
MTEASKKLKIRKCERSEHFRYIKLYLIYYKKPWVAGGTLCYTKNLWKQNPFPDINIGEGTRFVWNVPEAHITRLHDNRFYVAIVHDGNTSAKRIGDRYWHTIDITRIQAILGEDYAFYAGIVEED